MTISRSSDEPTPEPTTIVLIHGLWMTSKSWEHWKTRYEMQGHTVLTPSYPGLDAEPEYLRRHPETVAGLSVPDTLDHLRAVVEALPAPPILIGHSFGGTFTQLLLARGFGAAGVAIDSAPTEGVRVTPRSQARSLFPVLRNPANRHRAVDFNPEQWHYAITNTLSRADAAAAYERYAIPAPGGWIWDYGLLANFTPGLQATAVDYTTDRAPLLFVAGGADHLMPPVVNRHNADRWRRSPALTDYHEHPGRSHWTCAEPGWEAVADHALTWALDHAQPRPLAAQHDR